LIHFYKRIHFSNWNKIPIRRQCLRLASVLTCTSPEYLAGKSQWRSGQLLRHTIVDGATDHSTNLTIYSYTRDATIQAFIFVISVESALEVRRTWNATNWCTAHHHHPNRSMAMLQNVPFTNLLLSYT